MQHLTNYFSTQKLQFIHKEKYFTATTYHLLSEDNLRISLRMIKASEVMKKYLNTQDLRLKLEIDTAKQ